MASNAQPSQKRSRRRRETLLRAAIELLGEGGQKSVTHRAVAARAGLPPSTATYYFGSVDEMIDQALGMHMQERFDELVKLAERALADSGSLDEISLRFAHILTTRATRTGIVEFEAYLRAARDPNLRQAAAKTLGSFEGVAATVLAELGIPEPEQAATAITALVNGFALRRITRPQSIERDTAALSAAMQMVIRGLPAPQDARAR